MNAQHTSGPWQWDGNPCEYDDQNEAPWLVDAKHNYPPVLGGTIKCANHANARLIAAAPELLDALVKARSAIAISAGPVPDEHEALAIQWADAAIAKATGGGI